MRSRLTGSGTYVILLALLAAAAVGAGLRLRAAASAGANAGQSGPAKAGSCNPGCGASCSAPRAAEPCAAACGTPSDAVADCIRPSTPPKEMPAEGPAALEMVAGKLGVRISAKDINALPLSAAGHSLERLARAATSKGLSARYAQVGFTRLVTLPKPLIVWMKGNHFVAVVACTGNSVTVLPTGRQQQTVPKDEFQKYWTGLVLEVGKP